MLVLARRLRHHLIFDSDYYEKELDDYYLKIDSNIEPRTREAARKCDEGACGQDRNRVGFRTYVSRASVKLTSSRVTVRKTLLQTAIGADLF